MNNVSAKRGLKIHLLVIIVFSIVWVILFMFQVNSALIFMIPFFGIFVWISAFGRLFVADINIDETNGILIVTTVLKEKKLLLKDLKIGDHSHPARPFFIVYTNKIDITTVLGTPGTYNTIIRLFELTNYSDTNRFNAQIQKLADNFGVNYAED